MKRILLVVCSFSFFICVIAQETGSQSGKDKMGLTVSVLGKSIILVNYSGDIHYQSRRSNTFAVNYVHAFNELFDLETGFEFSGYSTTIYPFSTPQTTRGVPLYAYYGDLNLVNIPLTVRVNFWRYFYFNGGLLLNMDLSTSSGLNAQNGIGSMIGIGWKYDFKSGWAITINPYYKVHSVISFSSDPSQRFLDSGYRLGISVPLK